MSKVKEYQNRHKELGLCIYCSNKSVKNNRCEPCRERIRLNRRIKYNIAKNSGQCCYNYCKSEPIQNKKYCQKHLLKKICLDRLGTAKYSTDLLCILKKQNNKCALTGDDISLCDDIELDHIIPVSRGGLNNINNVRWVTKQANRLKGNFLDSELIKIITKIQNNLAWRM